LSLHFGDAKCPSRQVGTSARLEARWLSIWWPLPTSNASKHFGSERNALPRRGISFAVLGCEPDYVRAMLDAVIVIPMVDIATNTWLLIARSHSPRFSITNMNSATVAGDQFEVCSCVWSDLQGRNRCDRQMNRKALLLMLIIVGGCSRQPTLDVAACRTEADRFYQAYNAVDADSPRGRYIIACMAAKRYDFDVGQADCDSRHPLPTQPTCYARNGWLDWIIDRFHPGSN
jgi:hypothetical protein